MNKLILKSHKQVIANSIIRTGLEPSLFHWETEKSKFSGQELVSKLCYGKTSYYFVFEFYNDRHYCIFSPGPSQLIKAEYPGDWPNQLGYVDRWLVFLKREIESVDPWEDIDKYLPGDDINLEDEKENSPYTYDQVEHISIALNKLKVEIKNSFGLGDEQFGIVQNKLDYLIDRSKKMGRIDWKNLFVGTLMGLASNLILDPEKVKILWNLVKTCFKGVLLLGN